MAETRVHGGHTRQSDSIISRFWGFEKLIGSALVKLVYYVGLIGIIISVLVAVFKALELMNGYGGGGLALGAIVTALLVGTCAVVFWRFIAELAVLAFQTYNRLGEIRDRLPPPTS